MCCETRKKGDYSESLYTTNTYKYFHIRVHKDWNIQLMILNFFHIKYDVRNIIFIHVTFYDQRTSKYRVPQLWI